MSERDARGPEEHEKGAMEWRGKTSSATLQAMHYRYDGDIKMDQWFDDRGRWVKTSFKGADGSTIEYVLKE